jgi:hypothetical protein
MLSNYQRLPQGGRLRPGPDGAFELLAFAEIAGFNHPATVVPDRAQITASPAMPGEEHFETRRFSDSRL